MNTPITLQLAKLLKEKKYENEDCENVYLGDFDEEFPPLEMKVSTRNLRQRNLGEFDCLAPTITEVVMWIYEKYGVWISVNLNFKYQIESKKHGILHTKDEFNSPTEAYEAAIEYTLNNLI